ncbi:hypothetical protein GALL_450660 [mine drainage metagenome]|uniref:Uncharacterized protein n=1 Tax=mine drainage metagenome TaxID=410659 RepID=A0A1J5PP88_9ZZZZ
MEEPSVQVDIGFVKVVAAHLVLGLPVDLAVSDVLGVADVLEVRSALKSHHDALQAIGQFDRHRVEREASGLLEVGELGDLHAVKPDFPPKSPGAQRRGRPVVLDEADVVGVHVDPNGFEAGEVHLLRARRCWLEDHLKLGVSL